MKNFTDRADRDDIEEARSLTDPRLATFLKDLAQPAEKAK